MLMKSDINPFESQETKPYKSDPRISAMTDLVDAYQRDDIHRYESILQNNRDLLADPFIAENIDEVTRNMRTKGVLKLVAPYTRFTLNFVAKQLKISVTEVQDIIAFLILDKKIKGRISQEKGMVEIEHVDDTGRIDALQQWTLAVGSLWRTILNDGEGFKTEDVNALGGTSTNLQLQLLDNGGSFRGGKGLNESGKLKSGARKGFSGSGAARSPVVK